MKKNKIETQLLKDKNKDNLMIDNLFNVVDIKHKVLLDNIRNTINESPNEIASLFQTLLSEDTVSLKKTNKKDY